MRKLSCILIFFLVNFDVQNSCAQITFQRTYSLNQFEVGHSVKQTNDGGYIIAGDAKHAISTAYDTYLIKTDSVGDTLWTRIFGGTVAINGVSVEQTSDGGYIVSVEAISLDTTVNSLLYLIKTNANGDTLWTNGYGGTGTYQNFGYSVQQTSDGGYVVTGRAGYLSSDVILVRTDSIGDTLWTRTYGGIDADIGRSVQQTSDGGFIIAGGTESFGPGFSSTYLIKTDSIGNLSWSKTFSVGSANWANSVQQTNDGGYIMVGNSCCNIGKLVTLIKTDNSGNLTWSKSFSATNQANGNSIQQTSDGGYIVGVTLSDTTGMLYSLIKINATGNTVWMKSFSSGSSLVTVSWAQQTVDSGYIVTGWNNWQDLLLRKTDSNGNNSCYDSTIYTMPSSPATVVTSPPTQVASGGLLGRAAITVGSGAALNTICTSVNMVEIIGSNSFFVFPNPFTDELVIMNTGLGEIKMFDITGKEILYTKTSDAETKINTVHLTPGFYFVNYKEGERSVNKKVVKM